MDNEKVVNTIYAGIESLYRGWLENKKTEYKKIMNELIKNPLLVSEIADKIALYIPKEIHEEEIDFNKFKTEQIELIKNNMIGEMRFKTFKFYKDCEGIYVFSGFDVEGRHIVSKIYIMNGKYSKFSWFSKTKAFYR